MQLSISANRMDVNGWANLFERSPKSNPEDGPVKNLAAITHLGLSSRIQPRVV